MTELPPPPDELDDDELDDPWHDHIVDVTESFGSADIQAVVAFVLALISVCGFGLLNGSNYIAPFFAETEHRWLLGILGALGGAVLALVPLVLGWRVHARLLPTDARWIAVLARAAVILALISVVLRLVLTVLAAAAPDPFDARGF